MSKVIFLKYIDIFKKQITELLKLLDFYFCLMSIMDLFERKKEEQRPFLFKTLNLIESDLILR